MTHGHINMGVWELYKNMGVWQDYENETVFTVNSVTIEPKNKCDSLSADQKLKASIGYDTRLTAKAER